MKRTAAKRLSAFLLSLLIILPLGTPVFASEDYTIISPYSDVDWSSWQPYKGNLHTHSTTSDSSTPMADMVIESYNQGFDFLAMSEHGVTGRPWNEKQPDRPLYFYHYLLGNKKTILTDAQFSGITSGTYHVGDTTMQRGYGMTCVTGANELNAVAITKSHVNGYFLPENVGNSNIGFENGFEYAVRLVDKNGGLSHINHPGDWIEGGLDGVNNPENIALFSEILLKYDSCLGIEVFNSKNHTEPYSRILWDNLLNEVLPYGRTVLGFSNNDAHYTYAIDSSFSVFMMEENTVENIKKTMQSGAFFGITRKLGANNVIGPSKGFDYIDQRLPYPMFTKIKVSEHQISFSAENFNKVQWIANGKVIFSKDISPDNVNDVITLDLDAIDNSEDFLYVRAELFGDGGMCISQPFIIDNSSAPLVYEEEKNAESFFQDFIFLLKSTRVYILFQELIRAVK